MRVAPEPVVLIPTKPEVAKMADVFKEAKLALVVAKTLGAAREFETQTLPATFNREPLPVVLIPTKPEVPKMASVFKELTLVLVVAKTLGAARAFETQTLPATFSRAPPPVVLIPTKPVVPIMVAVFREAALAFIVAKTLGAARALETQTLPATFSLAPPPAQFRPTKPVVDTMVVVMRFVTFANEVAKTFRVPIAFEAQTFPATLSVAPEAVVLIPTRPAVPKMADVFNEAKLALVVAKTLGVDRALEAQKLP